MSGILILLLPPFELNDQIIVGETKGNVERIDLRATQLKTYNGRVVLVPNAELSTSRIINNTASPVRRSRVSLPIGYDSDLAQVGQITNQTAQATVGVLAEPPTSVRIQELGPDDILLEVRF